MVCKNLGGVLYWAKAEDEKDAFSGTWWDLQVGNVRSCSTLSKYGSSGCIVEILAQTKGGADRYFGFGIGQLSIPPIFF